MAISDKQQRFVDEYLVDLNATQAAIRAGYSARTAGSQGERLLKKAEIIAAVEAARSERAQRTNITQDRVLLEMARLGLSDFRKMFTPGGNLLPINELDDDIAAAVSSVKVTKRKVPDGGEDEIEDVIEIKLWDKNSALDKLGKHLGMFREQIDVNLKSDLATLIAERRARASAK